MSELIHIGLVWRHKVTSLDNRNHFKYYRFYYLLFLYVLIRVVVRFNYPISYEPIKDAHRYLVHSTFLFSELKLYFSSGLFFILFLKLLHQNLLVIFLVQLIFSIFAWWLFATLLYEKISSKSKYTAYLICFLILLLSCSIKISEWDSLILTESLTVSFYLIYMYVFFKLLENKFTNKLYLFSLILIILCFMNIRTTNCLFLVFCIPLYIFLLFKMKNSTGRAFIVFYIMLILCNFVFNSWATNKSRIWKINMGNVIMGYFPSYPIALDYFVQHGMPLIARQTIEHSKGIDFNGFGSFADSNTKSWFTERSRGVYAKFLITHPSYLFSPLSISDETLLKPNNLRRTIEDLFSIGEARRYVVNYFPDKRNHNIIFKSVVKLTIYFPYCLILLCIWLLAFNIKKFSLFESITQQAVLYHILVSIPVLLFILHADSAERFRHELLTYVNLSLSIFLGIAMTFQDKNIRCQLNLRNFN